MNKFASIILISTLLTACSASITKSDVWDELRCAEEGGLIIEGDPLKCRISKEVDGEIVVVETYIGEKEEEIEEKENSPKLSSFLISSNISSENIWMIENPVIGEEGAVVLMNSEYVQLYLFNSDKEAMNVHQILDDETHLPNDVLVKWGDNAIFFLRGNIIAVYQGDNTDLLIKED